MMTPQRGFTILEMLMAMVLVGLLVVGIMFAYLTCFRAFDSGQDRITIRTKLSQAMDLMARELSNAQSITSCSSTSLTFTANLGSGLASYTFALSGSNLVTDGGVTRATGIQTPGASVVNIFTCSNGLVTIDMTAVQNGTSVRLQNNIMPRNMPIGLAGWWQFDEATSGTCLGVVLTESSGNNNIGMCFNSPTWTTGAIASDPINGAMSFNSADSQYVSVSGSSSLQVTGTITLSAWINPSNAASNQAIVEYGNWGTDREYGLELAPAGPALTFSYNTSQSVTSSALSIPNNVWTHVVVTLGSGGAVTFYVNGVSVATATAALITTISAHALTIGMSNSGTAIPFNGSIDDVRIYNRVLSASEVSQLYNAGIGN